MVFLNSNPLSVELTLCVSDKNPNPSNENFPLQCDDVPKSNLIEIGHGLTPRSEILIKSFYCDAQSYVGINLY